MDKIPLDKPNKIWYNLRNGVQFVIMEVTLMSTYEPKKLLSEYGNDRMDVEMAMGHALQHIEILDNAKTKAGKNRQALQNRIQQLETDNKQLHQKTTKISLLENKVTSLNVTLYQLKDEVDSLKVQLQKSNEVHPSAKKKVLPNN